MRNKIIGFYCEKCGKPFFMVINDPKYIIECAKEIKKYQKQGYKFADLKENHEICSCECKQ